MSFDLGLQGYNEDRGREFQRRLLDKVRSMPGIEAAGMIDGLPLTLNISYSSIYLEGKPEPRPGDAPMANMYQHHAGLPAGDADPSGRRPRSGSARHQGYAAAWCW